MDDRPNPRDPRSPERNPLGLGARDRDSSDTGSTDDTSYNAHGSDPYRTGEPLKDVTSPPATGSHPADPDTPSSDEP